jgi:5-oxoprolinase (ATP-hydrolysing)/N-methylhydantoinase A
VNEQKFDPVSLEILWSRLINITEECWITIHRTAFSMIIGEAQDFGCELMDPRGDTLAHSPRSMPVFNLTLPRAVRALVDHFRTENLEEGDVLITNDPWICAGHLFDVAVVTPVFRGGGLVGLVGSIAHCSDIGGTRDTMSVREIYEEGLQIPPLKLYRRGEANDDLLRLIRQNVRTGEMVLGDIYAQVGANGVAAERLVAFMGEYGLDDLSELAQVVQERAERAMREAIAAVPDGEYAGSAGFDGLGEPMELPVRVVVEDDGITVDWSGAPDQLERGGINCTLSYTEAHTAYALKCILTPEVPSNAGCFRPIRVTAPEGSILNCEYPASVNQRTVTGWACAPAIFGALAEALPEGVQAFTGLPMGAGAYGRDADGRTFNDHLFQGGGQGASAHGDGKSALLFPTSAANTSVEMFETRTPLLVEKKELITDSGGAGRHRGGLGQQVQVRKMSDDGSPALMGIHPQGMLVDIPGLFGGHPGRRTGVRLEEDGIVVGNEDLGSLVELRRASQLLTIELAGGSGYGDPNERSIEAVQADLDAGLISAEGAGAYGCEVDASGKARRTSEGRLE